MFILLLLYPPTSENGKLEVTESFSSSKNKIT